MKPEDKKDFPVFPRCFVCGQENSGGLKTEFTPHDQGASAVYTPRESHIGYEDKVHGGIISALLDEAVVWASFVFCGRFGVTAELHVKFLEPVTTGKKYSVQGRGTKTKGRLTLAESWIEDESGTIYAKASGKVVG